MYTGINGGIDALLASPNYPGNPASVEIIEEFEAPGSAGDNYGQRVRGYIVAPQTGDYTFWISSDDQGQLFLSNNEQPDNRRLIAEVQFWTDPRQWDSESGQRSQPITLEQGRIYYIEALMVEGGGADHLAVRWQLPDGTIEEPIPNNRLFVELIPPQIARQPQNVTAIEGGDAVFSVVFANRAPVAMQWYRNDQLLPGATNTTLTISGLQVSDNASRFLVRATNLFSTNVLTSAVAFLNVQRDVTPPTLVAVQTAGENDIIAVTFSEAIAAESVASLDNFFLVGDAQVTRATLDESGRTVILRTTPMSRGSDYTLLVNNVNDRASQPNPIEPDTSVDFHFGYNALDAGLVYGRIERPGPSTRRSGLVISEIMYHPAPQANNLNLEFIEIYNSQEFIESIGGYRVTGAIEYTFPEGTFIPARSYIVVAAAPLDIQTVYGGQVRVYGPYTNSLPDAGTIRLRNDQGAVLLEIPYDSDRNWPVAADGAGHSLVLSRASYGEADPQAWTASAFVGGSPGRVDAAPETTYNGVVINEFLAHTDLPQLDFVELYNYSDREIDLSGVYLSDDVETNKFRIAPGTRIAPLGFVRFDETQLGFALSSAGEKIILRNPNRTRVIEAVRFGPQANGISMGRFPDGHPRFRTLSVPTPGADNARPRLPEVVINEIMYNPVSGNQDEEYIELFNRSGSAVNLRGWRLEGGAGFTFASDFSLAPGAYLAIAKNLELLRSGHPALNAVNSIGNFNGSLANSGERIVLSRPEILLSTNNNAVATNIVHVTVDTVEYDTGGRWPHWADGGGSSLELIDANSDNEEPSNWADSDESGKSQWVTIERRGLLNLGSTNFTATNPTRNLHAILMEEGEALLDNVQVFRDGGPNLVTNPGFETGDRDWLAGGTHESSTVGKSEGRGGAAMHIRATGRGDTASNRLRARLSGGLTNGEIATIRADVRWLRGTPEILLRLHGNFLELAGVMPLPKNLGTPGAANSRRGANTGPSVEHVQHSPILPAAGQAVKIVAEIDDPDLIALVMLNYRVDPSTNYVRVPMAYNGAGFYSGTVPGQNAGATVAFYIEAMDARGGQTRFPAEAPAREGVVYFGDSTRSGNFATYRLWLTQTNLNRWRVREQSSNKALDATFVYNNERIIYNMGTLYSGSPFHWRSYNGPLGSVGANYLMVMPDDDLFLGQSDFVLNLPSNIASDNTGVREQVFFWMVNEVSQPFPYRRFHHLHINGVNRNGNSIFEDAQQPGRDFVEQWFPEDSGGELYKIEDWFEYNDTFGFFNADARLRAFYTTNLATGQRELKKELYRWWFRKRAVRDSAHDYTELLQLVEAANTVNEEEFVARVSALIDVDEWMGAIATRHASGDWDAFGYARGKNMYAYKPQNGKWKLLHWDVAFAFGLGDGVQESLYSTIDEVTARMMQTPVFRRAFLRAFHEFAYGPMVASRVNAVIDSKFGGLVANGIPVSPPETVKTWIAQRREYILSQLTSASAGFSITSNNGNNFTTNRNTLVLTGTAPVNVSTIKVNGMEYPIEWTSVNTWRTRVALRPQQNQLSVEGFDLNGKSVAGAAALITVTLTSQSEAIAGRVLINEILANPLAPEMEFIELHNTARLTSFDLSGYRLNGLGFTFPAGSVITPGGFLVVARDAVGFGSRFGYAKPLAGIFGGAVNNEGEAISLLAPPVGGSNAVVSAVRFDDLPPWPALAGGASLQLVDPTQDASRVANWSTIPGNATPGATNSVRAALGALPLLWVNEVQPVNLNGPADQAGDRDPWVEIYNSGAAAISLSGYYLTDDYSQLTKWAFPAGASLGAGQRAVVWLDGEPGESTATEWHASFRLAAANSSVALVTNLRSVPTALDYLRFGQVPAGQSYGAFAEGQAVRRELFFKATPGAANDLTAPPARVFINEWMASNTRTVQDPDDLDFDDWFELYNAGAQPADLSGYTLTDDLTDPGKFVIPPGTVIPAGGFLLVWADEERSTNGQVHASFKLSANGESLGLFAPDGSTIDSLSFPAQDDDVSRGRSADGGAQFANFTQPTPGGPNAGGGDPNAPRFGSVRLAQGQLTLAWSSEAGATYRVEYKASLSDAAWTLLREVPSAGAQTTTTDPAGPGSRFYRVSKKP